MTGQIQGSCRPSQLQDFNAQPQPGLVCGAFQYLPQFLLTPQCIALSKCRLPGVFDHRVQAPPTSNSHNVLQGLMDNESAAKDVDEMLAQAIAHHRDGELTKAEWAYEALLQLDPDHIDANHLLGVVAHQMGNTPLAIERINKSLNLRPEQPGALNNLGNIYAAAERLEEAIDSYRRAIELKPDYAEAHHNLGNVLTDCDRIMESLECFHRAAELKPDDAVSWSAFGSASEKLGRFDQAVTAYQTALSLAPDDQQTLSRLGAVYRKMDRLEDAKDVYATWLQHAPDHPVAQHFFHVCQRGATVPERASAEYVKATFDSFADEFDSCLEQLGYQVPQQLGEKAQTLLEHCRWSDISAVDLGCGTGLCGPYLRDQAATLVGVDLSPAMLAKADERQLYDELLEVDLVDYLTTCRDQHDLILSADTLIYLGDLRGTLAAACDALRQGGHLLFSLEKLDDANAPAGFRLATSGRYQHTRSCIETWLEESGFRLQELVETTLREEGGESIIGFLITATKV